MEKMTSANPHFHVALLLNGNKATLASDIDQILQNRP